MSIVQKFILVVLVVLVASWAWAEPWDITPAFEGEPIDTDPVSEADDRMREIKLEVRRRLEPEHWFGGVGAPPGDDDNGLHRLGAARAFFQDAEPTALDGGSGDYEYTLETEQAETDLDDSASNSGGAIEDDVGHGRLWVDSNSDPDNNLQVFMGVAGDGNGDWEEVSAVIGTEPALDDEILAGSYNLVYNGSFDVTDGTGAAAATAVPLGWVNATSTFTYTDPSGDIRWGDGYDVEVTSVAGPDQISQVLTNLNADSVYKVIARVEDDGTTVCRVSTTGADTDMANTDTTTDAWETITGAFITAAALDTVTLNLITVTAGQVCLWDHVAVYEVGDVATDRDEVPQPGRVSCRDTDVAVTNSHYPADNWTDSGLICTLPVPGPGYNILVQGQVTADNESAAAGVAGRLTETCTTPGAVVAYATATSFQANDEADMQDIATINIGYTNRTPTPGDVCVYTIQLYPDETMDKNGGDDADEPGAPGLTSWIEAHLIPTR